MFFFVQYKRNAILIHLSLDLDYVAYLAYNSLDNDKKSLLIETCDLLSKLALS